MFCMFFCIHKNQTTQLRIAWSIRPPADWRYDWILMVLGIDWPSKLIEFCDTYLGLRHLFPRNSWVTRQSRFSFETGETRLLPSNMSIALLCDCVCPWFVDVNSAGPVKGDMLCAGPSCKYCENPKAPRYARWIIEHNIAWLEKYQSDIRTLLRCSDGFFSTKINGKFDLTI